jgi:nitroreductase
MPDQWLEPYLEAVGEFPIDGSPSEKLRGALSLATRAPSIHNTQPWRCILDGDALEVHADRSRALAEADRDGRELMISCGCLVEHLYLVLAKFGCLGTVAVFPDPARPDLVAVIRLGAGRAKPIDEWLFSSITTRRTDRGPFERRSVPARMMDRAARRAKERGAELVVADRALREGLIQLIVAADRAQMANQAFRAELAHWLRPPTARYHDGIPSHAGAGSAVVRSIKPLVVRRFDVGSGVAALDRDLAAGSPVLAVLLTAGDSPRVWFQAGRALTRVLLSLTGDGLSMSFFSQPLEDPARRAAVRTLCQTESAPQILLRIGFGKPGRPTARRPLEEILTTAGSEGAS